MKTNAAILAFAAIFLCAANNSGTETFSKVLDKEVLRRTISGKRIDFTVQYVSRFDWNHTQYVKKYAGGTIKQTHCRWNFRNYKLVRVISVLQNGSEVTFGQRDISGIIPGDYPDDSTKVHCSEVRRSHAEKADRQLNVRPEWEAEMAADRPLVERAISERLQLMK